MFYRTILLLVVFLLPISAFGAEQSIPYTVLIKGIKNRDLKKALSDSSDTVTLIKKPPATFALLELRAKADSRRFRQLLDSRGYYAATVHSTIDKKTTPATVIFNIQPDKPFVFADTTIITTPALPSIIFPSAKTLGLEAGKKADATTVIAAQNKLLRFIKEQGYPFPTIKEPEVTVDHKTRTMTITFTVLPGHIAHFGTTDIIGLETIDRDFITGKIPWKQGELYTPKLLEKYEKNLNESGLFAIATVSTASNMQEDGTLPIIVIVKERAHRTIKAGVNYQTDEGPGVKLTWQNRNFFHNGEKVEVSTAISNVQRTLSGSFTRNDFLRHDQSLILFSSIDNEDTEAYYGNNITLGTTVERQITQPLKVGVGTNYKVSHIKQTSETNDYGLVSFPLYLNYDTRDNILDPSKGHNSNVQFSPSLNTWAGNSSFTKEYASTTHYFAFKSLQSLVFASRAALGLIQSPTVDNLPPNERFYAGGSGSVRGYGYQSLGQTEDGTPTGGRSLVEVSGELRYKITPTIGLVSFIDGGNSFDAMLPNLREGIYFGGGVGIRYYTEIAPIRFDVAMPLNAPAGTKNSVQFYISLGQAF